MADDIRTKSVSDLGLSEAVVKALTAGGVETIGALTDRTEKAVAKVVGDDALPQVRDALALFELTFAVEMSRAEKRAAAAIADAAADREAGIEGAVGPERLHHSLDNETYQAIVRRAQATVEKRRREAQEDRVYEEELARLEAEAGQITGGAGDEMVWCSVDLAEHSPCITLNGRQYWHGHSYKVPRHVADTLREIMMRGQRHQDEIDGKSLTQHYQRSRFTSLSPVKGIQNAPGLPA